MKNKSVKTLALMIAFTAAWWGAMYPEFMIMTGSCRMIDKNGMVMEPEGSAKEAAMKLLEAKDGDVVVKSQLLEYLKEWYGYDEGSIDSD